jgi:dihydropteroate synthase
VRAPLGLAGAADVQSGHRTSFSWDGRRYSVPLPGAFQAENAALALSLARRALVTFDPAKAAGGLEHARVPGRLEILGRRPTWIVDVAHNPFAIRASVGALRAIPGRRTLCIFGASRDKDWRAMIRALKPGVDFWICAAADNPRAADPADLAREAGIAVTAPSVARAVELADLLARPDDRVLVTGSFYVAGEALRSRTSSGSRLPRTSSSRRYRPV